MPSDCKKIPGPITDAYIVLDPSSSALPFLFKKTGESDMELRVRQLEALLDELGQHTKIHRLNAFVKTEKPNEFVCSRCGSGWETYQETEDGPVLCASCGGDVVDADAAKETQR